MAINVSPGSPLRHVATFNSSGTYLAPANANLAFISIHGSSGGGGGSNSSTTAGTGGTGVVAGAYVQITPSGNHIITIGAGGTPGAGQTMPTLGQTGGTGGTTSFDGALNAAGGAGGFYTGRYSPNTGAGGTASGFTSLTTVNPAGALVRTGTISSQNTGGVVGGAGGNAPGGRYSNGQTGTAGSSGQVHVYI